MVEISFQVSICILCPIHIPDIFWPVLLLPRVSYRVYEISVTNIVDRWLSVFYEGEAQTNCRKQQVVQSHSKH
jgi:hypothetical protein